MPICAYIYAKIIENALHYLAFVLRCSELRFIQLQYSPVHCITLCTYLATYIHYRLLPYISLYYILLPYITLHCITWVFSLASFHVILLHCVALHTYISISDM